MDARKRVEKAAEAVAEADAEVTRTQQERNAALCDASASGVPKAQIARAATMGRAQVVNIIEEGAGRARGGDVLARVTHAAAAARAAREARHAAVLARDAVLVAVADAGEMSAAEAARIAGVPASMVSQARARMRAETEQPA